jgi:ribosomal protein S18 acetylase RimI-like enzyme
MERARRANVDDVPAVARLARSAIAELRPTRGGEVWARREARAEPLEEAIAGALAQSDHLVLCGTIDDTIVGYAVTRLETLRDERPIAVIDDIYVEEGARSVGVGEALMEMTLNWAREHQCTGIDAFTLPGNRATKNFFETFGLTARGIIVHRRLDDG